MALSDRANPGGHESLPEYVHRCQVHDVLAEFAVKHAPHLSGQSLAAAITAVLSGYKWVHAQHHPHSQQVASDTVLNVKPPENLQISFHHDCLALGCRDTDCTLCQYNPVRACGRSFSKKYLVGDALKATCGAPIRAELNSGGTRWDKEVPGVAFEVALLDGVVFKEKGGESRQLPMDDIKACLKFTNHRDEALLQLRSGAYSSGSRKIVLRAENGRLALPEMHVTDSSEALLTGRKPPFRLIFFPVSQEDGSMLPDMAYGVSEEFVVATRRVKLANKSEIPLMDDHVGKIEHIGRETMKKLLDIRAAAAEGGMMLQLPDRLLSVSTVGQFVELVGMAEKEAHLKKVLQIVLKLSKEKWEEAASHALQAVMSDFRRRVWYPPGLNMTAGLLFSAKYGAVQLAGPVALLKRVDAGTEGGRVIIQEDELDPGSLNMLRTLKVQAVNCWWTPGHPGWAICKETSNSAAAAPLPNAANAGRLCLYRPPGTGCNPGTPPADAAAAASRGFNPAAEAHQHDDWGIAGTVDEYSVRQLDGQRLVRRAVMPARQPSAVVAPDTASQHSPVHRITQDQNRKRTMDVEAGSASPQGAQGRCAASDVMDDSLTGLSALAEAAAAAAAAEDDAAGDCRGSSTSQDGDEERPGKAAKHGSDSVPATCGISQFSPDRKQVLVSMPSLQVWASDLPVQHSSTCMGIHGSQPSPLAGMRGCGGNGRNSNRKVTITTSAMWPMTAQRDSLHGRFKGGAPPRSPSVIPPVTPTSPTQLPEWTRSHALQRQPSPPSAHLGPSSRPLPACIPQPHSPSPQPSQRLPHLSGSVGVLGGTASTRVQQLADERGMAQQAVRPAMSHEGDRVLHPAHLSTEAVSQPLSVTDVGMRPGTFSLATMDANGAVTLTLAQLAMLARSLAGASDCSSRHPGPPGSGLVSLQNFLVPKGSAETSENTQGARQAPPAMSGAQLAGHEGSIKTEQ